jgi:hypothetical protein
MKLAELPLDRWLVVEPVASNEVNLLSTHDTQSEAEVERDKRNRGLRRQRYRAIKTLAPVAGAQGCAAGLMHSKRFG